MSTTLGLLSDLVSCVKRRIINTIMRHKSMNEAFAPITPGNALIALFLWPAIKHNTSVLTRKSYIGVTY
ncbi:hypothetical protein BTUL_0016g00730 [Botrytis tulipae]|uniref:Uncharacterized protein n=1 Tax=Botrytis tulipae TaxID=87230 RepID=A0A4Z1F210_9HELO|nr:hypothetical protein BTUL_0016g00730 [Botrytis tulipae]